ncbi:uncharacterized protein LOC132930987 isoform X1 [Rhopalosiphum padi]|uniref:uncharacterized protein LOC132930987 isoform X1 n=1 Tax=Rhopalosiphum padi TaxID=40932 RepID=UPI00298E10DA|nr:uncharacterized protein LOC132930987 isoform X1 [Rhopalosiphum padi]
MTASHKTAATVVVLLLACVLSGLCQEQKNGEGFKCPEEFGYYPHPNDCSQYYVCVFGGALLESCTGGLMYSHELQTCDWPRNVGCGVETSATQPDNQENALALARSSDRQRHPSAQPQRATPSIFNQHHQVQDQQVNEQLVKQQQLYEEEDFRAIEDDSDRQQRVYRGQPSTLGQVARDRDGISKHRNIIPQFAGVEKNKQFQIPNQNYRNDTSKNNGKQRLKRQTRQSYSGMTRPRPTEMTMSTTNYALRKLPKDYRIAPKSSSYVPITNTDNSRQHKRCLYESKIYPGLMIPCPTSRYRMPPYRQQYEENDDVYDQVDDENPGKNEEIEDTGDYPENPDNQENLQNQEEYEEENSQPLNADEQFEQLVTRVRCKGKNCIQNNNNKYTNKENESQENEYENENENVNEEEESQEESPESNEEEQKPLHKPKPKPKPIPKPKVINPNLHKPLAVVHNYQPANFTKIISRDSDGVPDKNQNKGFAKDQEEEEEEEENSQESRLENIEEYNEGDDLQDDEYYYDDEEEYDQTPKKPKIPQKLTNIDDMKFKGDGDEPSESISKNTVLKNVSKTIDLHKPPNFELTQIPQRPKPYDSAAEAYTRIKDKNKPQDQQVMQMAIHETTVALNLVDEQKNKYKLPTKTDTTTVSAKYKPRPTIRPNILKRPQQISVPSYAVEQTVQPITTAKTTTSTSNRNGTQYDPAFYSIYDDDSEIYKDVDYGQFTLSSVNNNNNRLKPQHQPQLQPQPQLQLQSQPQQDTFRVPAPLQQPTPRYQANTYVPEYNLKITEEEAQREQQTKATYRSTVVGVSPFVPDRSKFKFPEQTSSPSRFTFPTSTPITSTLPSTTLSTILSYPSTPSLFLRPPSPQGSYFWTTTSTTQKSKPTPPDFRIIVDPYNTTQYDVTTHRGTVKTTPFKVRTTQAPTTTSTTPSTTTTTSTTTIRSVDFDQEYDVVVEDEGTGYIDDNSVEKTSTTSSTTKAPLRSSEFKSTNDYSRVKSGPSIQPVTVPAPTSKTVTECRECNEKPSRGRVRGGATYTTASSNDIDRGTPAVGRTRPTLKPSTSIVSKASEFVDVYKYAPTRPDPIYPTPQPDKTAAKCRKDVCQLPDCSCGGKEIPGDLAPEETPQIVLLTFDDSVNDLNKGLYTDLFEKGRVNPNGCPISATFYVSHEWTDYSQVQNLYSAGHEIASHSVSHSFGEQFSQKKWTKEIVGQREILSAYGGVRQEDIRGMRAPFLAVGGNKMFKMLYDSNFTYDSSMPIYENKPPSWPYTLDYKLFHDCMIPPCPTRSYPGVWEVPMVMWQDLNGGRCSMGDACSNPSDADGVQKMLMKNFDRHFTSNRAPFGLFYHAAWFTQPHHKEGFIKFLDNIVSMPEVWIVTNWQAIQWVRDPTSISRLQSFTPFHCDLSERPKKCNNPKVCNLWHKSGVRYMRTCQPCPDIYPWTGKTGIRSSRIDDGSE